MVLVDGKWKTSSTARFFRAKKKRTFHLAIEKLSRTKSGDNKKRRIPFSSNCLSIASSPIPPDTQSMLLVLLSKLNHLRRCVIFGVPFKHNENEITFAIKLLIYSSEMEWWVEVVSETNYFRLSSYLEVVQFTSIRSECCGCFCCWGMETACGTHCVICGETDACETVDGSGPKMVGTS